MTPADHEEVKAIVRAEVETMALRLQNSIYRTASVQAFSVLLPGVVAVALFYAQMQTVAEKAKANEGRLDARSAFIITAQARLTQIEDHLNKTDGYEPHPPETGYK